MSPQEDNFIPWGYAAAAVAGAVVSSQGAQSAANTQAGAQEQAANTQMQMYNRTRKSELPFIEAGQKATIGLTQEFGPGGSYSSAYKGFNFNPGTLQNMPGYRFQLRQGDKALQSSDATTVGALSGAAMKDLSSFNQGLASTYENQYFNQALSHYQTNQGNYYTGQQNQFNRLQQIASLGQNAAGNLGSNGANLGTGVAQAQAAAGGSIAAGQVAGYNAAGNAISSIPMYQMLAANNQGNTTTFQNEEPVNFNDNQPIQTGPGI